MGAEAPAGAPARWSIGPPVDQLRTGCGRRPLHQNSAERSEQRSDEASESNISGPPSAAPPAGWRSPREQQREEEQCNGCALGDVASEDAAEICPAGEDLGVIGRPASREDVHDGHVGEREDRPEQRGDGHHRQCQRNRHLERPAPEPGAVDEARLLDVAGIAIIPAMTMTAASGVIRQRARR